MKVFWHKGTRDDFAAIRLFYDQIDPSISDRLIERIFGLTRHLARFPELGRPGRVRGTLELPVKGTKFVIAYGHSAERLIIYVVYHAAREWPRLWLEAAHKTGIPSGEAAELDRHEVVERVIQARKDDDRSTESEEQAKR